MIAGKKIIAVSGGFDPVHIGHLRMLQEAKKLGDKLVVILNCDKWLIRKKGNYFMPAVERAEIIKGFSCVDDVYIHESDKDDVCDALRKIKPIIFANGGDKKNDKEIAESSVCKELNIKTVFNIGGSKIQSSSELVDNFFRNKKDNFVAMRYNKNDTDTAVKELNESIKKNKHKFNLPDWFLLAYHNQTLIIDKLNKLLRNDRSNN